MILASNRQMNQKELQHIRQAFNTRYVQKRDWPLRIDKPCVHVPPQVATTCQDDVAPSPRVSPPASPVAKSTFETVSFILRDAINDGFSFTFDRIGHGMVVLSVDKARRSTSSLSVGSLLVAINGHTVQLADDIKSITISPNPQLATHDQRTEAMRLQMVDLFKAHGISATSSTPCNATFVQTPTKVQLVHKWNRRSTYKPWSQVHLKLHCGYLNFYTSDAKADKATVDDMQNSVVAIPVMRCDVMCVDIPGKRGFCFQVLEVPPPPYQADSLDGDEKEDILPVDVSIVQSYSPNNDMTNDKAVDPSSESTMLDDMHAFLGSTNVVKKVVVVKEPKLYRFRVATAAARASWVRHIRAAQTCRAEDYLDQP